MDAPIYPQMNQLKLSYLKKGKWLEIFTTAYQQTILMRVWVAGEQPIVDIKQTVHGKTYGPPMILMGVTRREGSIEYGILRKGGLVVVKSINDDKPAPPLTGLIRHWRITNRSP